MNPTTGKITSKLYRCKRCGHEEHKSTNHYGECYSWGNFNTCPACPPYTRPTTWVCAEPCPPDMDTPANWQTVTVKVGRA